MARRSGLILVLGLLPTSPLFGAVPRPEDAPLHAVRFVDAREGWAVGDEGAILHSIDGGKTWERQPSGTTASLRGVVMLSPYTGWAVGRSESPTARDSAGVVLKTTDGGGTWREATATPLPGLNAVQFLDEQTGFAVGDATDLHPTGAFRTADGGRTWEPLRGPRGPGWRALDARAADAALLLGDPAPAIVKGSVVARPGALAAIKFGGSCVARHGAESLVGDRSGGLVRLSDAGTQQPVDFPAGRAGFGIESLCAVGPQVWCVGRPGTVVLHSPDFGKSWETFPTPGSAALRSVCMIDEKTGWACGDFGTVLGTADGGKTWTTLRSGGTHAAVLFLHARPEAVPLGLVAKLATEGYHAAAVVVGPGSASRLQAALRDVGGRVGEVDAVKAWPEHLVEPTPGRDPQKLPDAEDPALLARLVLAIRMYRPAMLVTDAVDPRARSSDLAVLLATKKAFTLAADPKAFPEQLRELRLTPHHALTLYGLAAKPAEADVSHDLTAVEPRFGQAWREIAQEATRTLTGRLQVPDAVGLRLIAHHLGKDSAAPRGLVPGAQLAEGGPSRAAARPDGIPPERKARREAVTRLLRELDATPAAVAEDGAKFATALRLVADIGEPRAALSLAERFAEDGQWTAACAVYTEICRHHSLRNEAVPAMQWLTRFYASGEVRRRLELGQLPILQKGIWEAVPADDAAVQPAGLGAFAEPRAKFRFATPEARTAWDRAVLEMEVPLAAFGSSPIRDPAQQFVFNAARRRQGLNDQAAKALRQLIAANPADARTDPTLGRLVEELRTLTEDGPETPYAPRATARKASARPHLDGKLNDDCWRDATRLPLGGGGTAAAGYATKARFLYDEQFLYIAVECGHPAGNSLPRAEARGRDDDLTGRDRVEILLDLDRDYATYYRLRVDQRGRVAEDCCGDASWNPKWFVAVEPTATGWTAELAIPLAELTGDPRLAGQTWAMNVTRVVPGATCEAWSGPPSAAPTPATMGQLRFADDGRATGKSSPAP